MIFPSYSKRPLKFQRSSVNVMEATPRFELGNKGFADLCLTTWLWRRIQITKDAYFCVFCLVVNGAEDEIRTRDVHLGKVTLYH